MLSKILSRLRAAGGEAQNLAAIAAAAAAAAAAAVAAVAAGRGRLWVPVVCAVGSGDAQLGGCALGRGAGGGGCDDSACVARLVVPASAGGRCGALVQRDLR